MSSEPARLRIAALDEPRVVALRGREGMSSLSRWHARLLWRDIGIDLEALVGEVAALQLVDMDGSTRALERLIDRVAYLGPARDGLHAYELELADFVWPLTHGSGYCIHQERTAQQVVAETLRAAGVDTARVVWRLGARYAQRVQCVQYGESDWAFVERVLADDGIAYWFEDGDRGQVLVLGDGVGAHEPIGGVGVPFDDGIGMRAAQAAVHELRRVDRMAPEAVFVRDHDLRQPELPVDGAAGEGALEHFEFPSGLPFAEAAAARAAVRLQQLQRDAVRVLARTSCIRFEPGRLARVDGVPDDLAEGEWLVAEVEHAVQPADRDTDATAYEARAVLVPTSLEGRARPFRPAAPAERPRIHGIETATVTGPSGEEVHVDDMGRVKLALRWDPSGVRDDRSSCWARTAQPQMGGSMLLPRVGWEVAVAYFDGNPDAPIVLAHLYNGLDVPPYALPLQKAVTAFRSDTSPHDGTSSEIRMTDDAGKQQMWIHAAKTQAVSVGGSAITTVAVNEAHDVLGGIARQIDAAQTVTVGATQEVIVGSAHPTKVGGARAETIGGSETIGVAKNRRVAAASYSEIIGAVYALQCNGASTTVAGAYSELVGGNRVAVAGLGASESVAAARLEAVGGSLNIVAGSAYADDTKGAKTIVAGAASAKAGEAVSFSSGAGLTFGVGGSATFTAGGPLVLTGSTVTLKAASITIDGGASLSIAGSAKLAGGTTQIDAGTVRRKSGVEEKS